MTLITTDPSLCGPVDIAVVAESTYPFLLGGVSAVIQDIVQANPERTIGIIHTTWDSSSDTTLRYDVPQNVAWVQVVYLSMAEHREDFLDLTAADLGMGRRRRRRLVEQLVAALHDAHAGDFDGLWGVYDEGLNPLTRQYPLAAVLGTRELMDAALTSFPALGMPLTDLFWQLREFLSLTTALAGVVYPSAGVYHAHTTGYAALIAAMAARQNGGKVVLTEHNLYVRDTINHLLDRSMALKVTATDYVTADVTPQQRAWMAWYTELGRMVYPVCDAVTYLYPEAITEAAALGGRPEISRVLPNGMTMADFEPAHERLVARQLAHPVDAVGYEWHLAFVARVVPIKGLLDLLDSLRLLVDRGVTNFRVSVMGPADHAPEYAALCYARCTELGLDDKVAFLGPQKVKDVLDQVDVFLLPSHNEGQPMAVLEAMTVGLPVVGTAVGGMRQVAVEPLPGPDGPIGPSGLLVAAHDVAGFAECLEQVMSDPRAYVQMQRNARARVASTFQLADAMRLYRDLYAELLDDAVAAAEPAPSVRPAVRVDLTRTAAARPVDLPALAADPAVIDLRVLQQALEGQVLAFQQELADVDVDDVLDDLRALLAAS